MHNYLHSGGYVWGLLVCYFAKFLQSIILILFGCLLLQNLHIMLVSLFVCSFVCLLAQSRLNLAKISLSLASLGCFFEYTLPEIMAKF